MRRAADTSASCKNFPNYDGFKEEKEQREGPLLRMMGAHDGGAFGLGVTFDLEFQLKR